MKDIVKTTLYEMMSDRNYTYINNINENILKFKNIQNETLLIYNTEDDKTGVKTIKRVSEMINEHDIKHLIFIYKKVITIFAKNLLDELLESIYIEIFSENELSYNVSKHCLVPKHRALMKSELNDILLYYKCSLNNFPIILKTDPISRYYDFKRGQLIEVTRSSETNGIYKSYRLVL